MLTEEENGFIGYWENNRLRKKKVWRQLSIGLPLAVVLVIAIFANLFSGWDKRAEMEMNKEQSSLILVLLAAALLIVTFIVIFSARHRWDLNEQRYKELLNRRDRS
jgi:membrane protein YdbS with pleckstrin-like domain